MAYLGKGFKYVGEENYAAFVDAIKVPAEFKDRVKQSKPDLKLEKNADGTFSITTSEPGSNRILTFTPGQEFDEKISDAVTAKTTVTVEGGTFTQVQKFEDGKETVTIKREYSDSDLKITYTSSIFDGNAVRLYKA